MASKDPDDIENCNRLLQLNRYIGELERRISELDSEKKELEDVQKRLTEISIQYYRSDDLVEREKNWKGFEELKELYNINDVSSSNLDLGVGSSSIGKPSKDDVNMGTKRKFTQVIMNKDSVKGKNEGPSSNAGIQKLKKDFEDVKRGLRQLKSIYNRLDKSKKEDIYQTTKDLLEALNSRLDKIKQDIDLALEVRSPGSGGKGKDSNLDLGVHSGPGGPSQEEGCKVDDVKTGRDFNQSCESSGSERKGKDAVDIASDSTETEKGSQKQGDVKNKFLEQPVSSDDPDEQPVSTDNEGISTNTEG